MIGFTLVCLANSENILSRKNEKLKMMILRKMLIDFRQSY